MGKSISDGWEDVENVGTGSDISKKEIYEEMFETEMQALMDYIGFNIEG